MTLSHAGRRARMIAVTSALVTAAVFAQRGGRLLHRPIPGDVPLDETPSAMPSVPPSSTQSIAQRAGPQSAWRDHQEVSGEVQRPRPTWDAPAREMDRQTRSAPNTRLQYQEVFTPAVQPFKRGLAHDMVDELGRLTVRDPSLHVVTVGEAAPAHWSGRRVARFVGELLVELSSSWPTPIPGIAGEQRVLRYSTSNGESVEFLADGAGNLFVRGLHAGTIRLTYLLEAPDFAFAVMAAPSLRTSEVAARVPEVLRPSTPSWLRERARVVLERLGVVDDWPFQELLARLVRHFRAFRDAELPAQQGPDLYSDLALNGVGACRHRAYAMMLTLHALGIPTRYVGNEAHAWVEVWIVDQGWSRVDLGGWDVPLDARAATDRPRFEPGIEDRFDRPASYERQFSSAATAGRAGGDAGSWLDPDAAFESNDPVASNGDGGATTLSAVHRPTSEGTSGRTSERSSSLGAVVSAGGVASAARDRPQAASELRVEDEVDDSAPRILTSVHVASVLADERTGFVSNNAFARGSMVRIQGFVRDAEGVGLNGLAVELHLVRNGRAVQGLGSATTGADGRFEAHVLLGAALELGEYALRVSTPGDARYAPSVSE